MTTEGIGPRIENYDTFMARFSSFSERELDALELAYQFPKAAHGKMLQVRLTGERYFEHPRLAALILVDECGLNKPEYLPIICATLLHDVAEDTSLFGNPKKKRYGEWIEDVRRRVAGVFNVFLGDSGSKLLADIEVAVTEPKVDGIDVLTEEQAIEIKHQKLIEGPVEGLLVKMSDRLHNLRTFVPKKKEGEKTPEEKIKETELILIPIFRRALEKYPKETEYLLAEIGKAIAALRVKFSLEPVS